MQLRAFLKRTIAEILCALLAATCLPLQTFADQSRAKVDQRAVISKTLIQGFRVHLQALAPLLPAAGPIEPHIVSVHLIQNAQPSHESEEETSANWLFVESVSDPRFARDVASTLSQGDVVAPELAQLVSLADRLHEYDHSAAGHELHRLRVLRRKFAPDAADNPRLAARFFLDELFDGGRSNPDEERPISQTNEEVAAIFGGTPHSANEILQRAEDQGIAYSQIADAIEESRTLDETVDRLARLRLLDAKKGSTLAVAARDGYVQFLRELWMRVALTSPAPFAVDRSRAVPGVVVQNAGINFHIHGILPGLDVPPLGALIPVRRLARALRAGGRPFYAEEKLNPMYGIKGGIDIRDRALISGKTVHLRKPDHARWWIGAALNVLTLALSTVVTSAVLIKKFVIAAPQLTTIILYDLIWAGAITLAYCAICLLLIPIRRAAAWMGRMRLGLAAKPALERDDSKASTVAFSIRRQMLRLDAMRDPRVARAAELPMPLRMDARKDNRGSLDSLASSQAMAVVVLKDAVRRKLKDAHILCGFDRVGEIAWFLSRLVAATPEGSPNPG